MSTVGVVNKRILCPTVCFFCKGLFVPQRFLGKASVNRVHRSNDHLPLLSILRQDKVSKGQLLVMAVVIMEENLHIQPYKGKYAWLNLRSSAISSGLPKNLIQFFLEACFLFKESIGQR